MFTGLIEEIGRVESISARGDGARLRVACRIVMEDAGPGASIAVNGVCLTAVDPAAGGFAADLAPETLRRSNLGDLRPGARVNLERPLAAGGRLGGHIVQGHIDATGELAALDELGDGNWWLTVRIPEDVLPYTVLKGSIAIDGISLTVASLEADLLGATIVPHTYASTTLADRIPGERLNLECDILAEYVASLLQRMGGGAQGRLTVEKLREMGY